MSYLGPKYFNIKYCTLVKQFQMFLTTSWELKVSVTVTVTTTIVLCDHWDMQKKTKSIQPKTCGKPGPGSARPVSLAECQSIYSIVVSNQSGARPRPENNRPNGR